MLQAKLTFLTTRQLLSEGGKVCTATHSGITSSDAVIMVQKDLAVGVPDAVYIVEAAVVGLGCSRATPTNHMRAAACDQMTDTLAKDS